MSVSIEVFRSHLGFHPCSREDYLLFKELHWLTYLDMKATRRWVRWRGKMPHNRRGAEPVVGWGTTKSAYRSVLAEYRNARMPASDPDGVKPLRFDFRSKNLSILRGHYGLGMVGKFP